MSQRQLYTYDWVDPRRWDSWLGERMGEYRLLMAREIESRIAAIARWAAHQGVPVIIGEGWIGYTPLESMFEEGAESLALAEHAVRLALEHRVTEMVLGSNFAPHHAAWALVDWQRRMNELIRSFNQPLRSCEDAGLCLQCRACGNGGRRSTAPVVPRTMATLSIKPTQRGITGRTRRRI